MASRLFFLDFRRQHPVTPPAKDTLFLLAIFTAQFNQPLGGECIVAFDTRTGKQPHDSIVLRTDSLKQLYASLHAIQITAPHEPGMEQRHGDINHKRVHRPTA